MTENPIIKTVFAVFTAIAEWIVSTVQSMVPIFYSTDGLTFIGVLSLCGVGVGIILLVFNLVRNFLSFR